jgi:hypothetical protein
MRHHAHVADKLACTALTTVAYRSRARSDAPLAPGGLDVRRDDGALLPAPHGDRA